MIELQVCGDCGRAWNWDTAGRCPVCRSKDYVVAKFVATGRYEEEVDRLTHDANRARQQATRAQKAIQARHEARHMTDAGLIQQYRAAMRAGHTLRAMAMLWELRARFGGQGAEQRINAPHIEDGIPAWGPGGRR